MSINFPLQLCIDPNCVCPAKAHILVKADGFHLEAPRPWESAIFPWSPASLGFPRSDCAVTTKTGAEKPQQTDYLQNHSADFKPMATNSIKWIIYLFVFMLAKKNCLQLPPPAHSGISWTMHAGRVSPRFATDIGIRKVLRNTPFLHVSVQTISFMRELRDSQSLQQISGKLTAICTEQQRKHELRERGVMQYIILFIISSGFLCLQLLPLEIVIDFRMTFIASI